MEEVTLFANRDLKSAPRGVTPLTLMDSESRARRNNLQVDPYVIVVLGLLITSLRISQPVRVVSREATT